MRCGRRKMRINLGKVLHLRREVGEERVFLVLVLQRQIIKERHALNERG